MPYPWATTFTAIDVPKNTIHLKGPSRIRFILVEAELSDGDISQVTQAITNALRPSTTTVKRISTTPLMTAEPGEPEIVEDGGDEEDGREAVDVTPAAPKSPRQRKAPKAPDVVEIDMNSDVSLATFAAGKDANSQHKKYLIAAAWLKEHRSINAVNASHIYRFFRSLGWSASIPDFWQPLRDLKAKKYLSKNESGEYEINHLGIDYVRKLGRVDEIS